jgi:hypothetical protein
MIRPLFALLIAALLGLGVARPALAADAPTSEARAAKVQVRFMVVHATSAHSKVDPRLKDLTRYFSSLKYTGYEVLQTESLALGGKGKESFTMDGGRKVNVELLEKDEKRVKMRVEMYNAQSSKLLDTTLSVARDGTFILAGPKYKDGILVLPVTASY